MGKHPWNEGRGSQQRNGSYRKQPNDLQEGTGVSLVVQGIRIRLRRRGHGFDPCKIPGATEQPSPCATAPESPCPDPVLCEKRSRQEQPQHRSEEWPLPAPIREGRHAAVTAQCSQE